MKPVALIDADILVYRCSAALRHTQYYVYTQEGELLADTSSKSVAHATAKDIDGVVEVKELYDDYHFAFGGIDRMIDDICVTTGSGSRLLFVTGDTNFRNELATIAPYKGNRPDRPRFYKEVKEYLWSLPGLVISENCEADDMLGVYSQSMPNAIVASLDKDLDMLPGQHYNFVNKQQYHITEEDGKVNFYRQILTGDKVDNIIGIYGVGPAKAEKLIRHGMSDWEMFRTCLRQYEIMYRKNGNDAPEMSAEKHVVENGKLLWIWRKMGDIWTPPVPTAERTKTNV